MNPWLQLSKCDSYNWLYICFRLGLPNQSQGLHNIYILQDPSHEDIPICQTMLETLEGFPMCKPPKGLLISRSLDGLSLPKPSMGLSMFRLFEGLVEPRLPNCQSMLRPP